MLNGKFVIDAVTHGFDSRPENRVAGKYSDAIIESNFDFATAMMPEGYRLSREQYMQRMTPEWVGSALFAESVTDVAIYHPLPIWGIFKDLSPASVGLAIREQAPNRMFVYAAVSPLQGRKALDELERQVTEWDGVAGLKLYPVDLVDGQMRTLSMSNREVLYPLLERARDLGIKVIAIHKALPLGPAPTEPFRPDDIDYAARDFPDLNFEIVHGGFAFLEETAFQLMRFDNVYVNLEATAHLMLKQPEMFSRILGTLLFYGGGEKIFWGTGAAGAGHPQPLLEAFEAFQFSPAAIEGYGLEPLDDLVKEQILGLNYVRAHGWDIEELKANIADDEYSARQRELGLAAPWSEVPAPAGAR